MTGLVIDLPHDPTPVIQALDANPAAHEALELVESGGVPQWPDLGVLLGEARYVVESRHPGFLFDVRANSAQAWGELYRAAAEIVEQSIEADEPTVAA